MPNCLMRSFKRPRSIWSFFMTGSLIIMLLWMSEKRLTAIFKRFRHRRGKGVCEGILNMGFDCISRKAELPWICLCWKHTRRNICSLYQPEGRGNRGEIVHSYADGKAQIIKRTQETEFGRKHLRQHRQTIMWNNSRAVKGVCTIAGAFLVCGMPIAAICEYLPSFPLYMRVVV